MGRELLLVWPQGLRRVRRGQCIEVWVTEIYLASYQNPVAALGPFHARDLLQVGAAAESLDCRLCGHDPQCLSPPGENVAHRAPTGFDQVVAWDVERLAEVFSSLYDATQQSPGLLPELWVGQKTHFEWKRVLRHRQLPVYEDLFQLVSGPAPGRFLQGARAPPKQI